MQTVESRSRRNTANEKRRSNGAKARSLSSPVMRAPESRPSVSLANGESELKRHRHQHTRSKDRLASAAAGGLDYVTDIGPGISRLNQGETVCYQDVAGAPLSDPVQLERIAALAIPPAWTNVWICPSENGHIQATGRDAKGRKQYRYHPRWHQIRDEAKYSRMLAFGSVLPTIRQKVEDDLALPGLPEKKVLAAAVRLLETTLIRVGNAEYAIENGSFGLMTMQDQHVKVTGGVAELSFKGKSNIEHAIPIVDKQLVSIVKRCRDIAGEELFQYIDEDGHHHDLDADDVNQYLRDAAGHDFTAKDFRTWAGTVLAARELCALGPCDAPKSVKRNIVQAISIVADRLGNTPTVCRKSYVHPAVLHAYVDGSLHHRMGHVTDVAPESQTPGLDAIEYELLALLVDRGAPSSNQRPTP